ncbi:rRNA adenine N-6-methyltransferase family protein, partial [Escherichia coli]|nr:rRNA adenine N-6-methyltransferase family protein [Escherichia coli]
PAYGPQNDVTLKMPAFEWVHVQLHQQKGMISLSPPTICNSAVNSVLIKLTRHTTDVPDKYWKLYTYFVSKWVNREYRQLFTKNQFHQAMKHAKVNNLSTVTYEQVLSIFNSYLLFNGRK